MSDFAVPFPVFPDSAEGGDVLRVEDISGGEFSAFEVLPGVAGIDGDMLHNARVPIAIDHALPATIANELALVEIVNLADRLVPGLAAVEVEVPSQVKYL